MSITCWSNYKTWGHYKSSAAEFFEVVQNSESFALRNCQRFPISTQDSRLKWSRAWWTDTPLDGSVTSQSEPRPIDTERPGCMTNCQNCSLETKLKNLPWRPLVWYNTYSFGTVRTDLKLYIKLPWNSNPCEARVTWNTSRSHRQKAAEWLPDKWKPPFQRSVHGPVPPSFIPCSSETNAPGWAVCWQWGHYLVNMMFWLAIVTDLAGDACPTLPKLGFSWLLMARTSLSSGCEFVNFCNVFLLWSNSPHEREELAWSFWTWANRKEARSPSVWNSPSMTAHSISKQSEYIRSQAWPDRQHGIHQDLDIPLAAHHANQQINANQKCQNKQDLRTKRDCQNLRSHSRPHQKQLPQLEG